MANLNPPFIEGNDNIVKIGESISVSNFFNVTDPDGDEIVEYSFLDTNGGADSGFLSLNGVKLAAGVFHTIAAEDLANLRYVAGTVVGDEQIRFRANDGTFTSNTAFAQAITVSENNTKPILETQDRRRVAYETISARALFKGHDPDGWPLVRYRFRDRNANPGSGYFILDNVRMASNQWFTVQAADFHKLFYYSGDRRTQENLLGRVYDGEQWSDVARSLFVARANANRPVVEALYIARASSVTMAITDLFNVTDADGNSIKTYEFRDASGAGTSGFVSINGVKQGAGAWISVDASQLGDVTYTTSSINRLDNLQIRVHDGKFLSEAKTAFVAVTTQPVVGTKPPLVFDGDEVRQLVSLIEQTDDGPRNVRYRIYDDSTNAFSARFELNGQFLNPRRTYSFTAAEMANVNLYSGDFNDRRLDEVYVQTFNGTRWSDWRSLKVRTEPHLLDAMANVEDSYIFNRNSWRFWLNGNPNQPQQITFSFRERASLGLFTQRFSNAERAQARIVLERLESIYNIDFVEVSDAVVDPLTGFMGGVMRIGHGGGDIGFNPDDPDLYEEGGDIFLSDAHLIDQLAPGTVAHSTFLRLVGNALGLRESASTFQYFNPLLFKFPLPNATDDFRNTVMSFNYNPDNEADVDGPIVPVEPSRLGIYDEYALEELYGFSGNGYAGDTVYGTTGNTQDINDWTTKVPNFDGTEFHDQAFQTSITGDSSGNDTIDVSGMLVSTVIDLTPGSYSSIGEITTDFVDFFHAQNNVAIGLNTVIENVIGGSSDELIRGNFADNILIGNAGDDILIGAGGNDILQGEEGNDTYRWKLTDQDELIRENLGGGVDVLEINSHWALNSFNNDFLFSRNGRDLVINLAFNGGVSQGKITIEDMQFGLSRVETLRVNFVNGSSSDVDMQSIFNLATTDERQMVLTSDTTAFGQIAALS